jgi:hypothetical protein
VSGDGDDKGFKVVDRRGATDEPAKAEPKAEEAADRREGLPEIDFATFVMSMASSALVHLGELAHPEHGARRDLPIAKQTIDILGMLAEKTRGNLTSDESKLIEHLLYDLRLKYVEAKKRG